MCVQILEPKFTYPIFTNTKLTNYYGLQDFNLSYLLLIFNIAIWAQFDLSWVQKLVFESKNFVYEWEYF